MAEPIFPANPNVGDHFVTDNRLWVYSLYTTEDGKPGYRWELWGNLQYVPVPGSPGNPGNPGSIGLTGATGPRGKQGNTGSDGPIGATGPAGVPGTGINLKGNVYDLNALEEKTPTAVNGDCWVVSFPEDVDYDFSVYVWDAGAGTWNWCGPLQGPQGPTGDDGAVGATGPGGQPGSDGVAGLNGAHGGAFAHMVDYIPSSGPAGKIYMLKGDHSLYVTTGYAEDANT